MTQELRANTEIIVTIGPFVAVGDGFVPITTVALGSADEAELVKHGTTAGIDIGSNTFAVLSSDAVDGYMNLTLTTTDTNAEGMLVVVIQDDSLILPFRQEYMVLSEAAYDSKYVAKDDGFMDVNIKTVGRADTTETEADNLEAACLAYSVTRGLSGTALPAVAADGAFGLPISDAGGLDLDTKLANTNEVTVARMGALTDWIDGNRLDAILDTAAADALAAKDDLANGTDGLTKIYTQMSTDVMAELTSVPSSTPTVHQALMLAYMMLKNKADVETSGAPDVLQVHKDDGTVLGTKDLTDAGGDYSEAKMS